jgi:serine/threonine-protein kinase RsbW
MVRGIKPHYNLTVPSERNSIEGVIIFAENIAKRMKLKKSESDNFAISVSEVVANAIIYGNKLNKDKKVKIDVYINENEITVKVKDEGTGFNPDILKNPTDPENILKETGRGLFILKNLNDKVDFNQTKEGFEVTFSKRFSKK